MDFIFTLLIIIKLIISVAMNARLFEDLSLFSYEYAEEILNYIDLDVPQNSSFKSRMDWKKLTNKKSKQYQLQQEAYTNIFGFRCIDDRFCIAVGSFYSHKIGDILDIHMRNGSILHCIVGDIKANKDTDKKNQQHKFDNSVIEFIIDDKAFIEANGLEIYKSGNISNVCTEFQGEIAYIRKYIDMNAIDQWYFE
ncbi:hypothetical protein [Lachnoclostridium sp.]|uniref:hypothetical protein n=1 Tax=Lachnoclostridium sp. TaxID=2028282 RepID=UPI0028A044C7|nr:hypothetical protein [Lachnoclostridium sp.]